jgi:basic amino acid/polyamine antiporter, APA family
VAAPIVPFVGALACLGLAVFQGLAVGSAGALASLWLGLGGALYLTLLAPGARVADASAEARDPELVRMRGRSPLVLVPIANPASAASLVAVAGALVTPRVGRILLLSVVSPPEHWQKDAPGQALRDAQSVLGEALHTSFGGELSPETLITVSADPWHEIARIAALHSCESLLLGLSRLDSPDVEAKLERLLGAVDSDVVVLRAPTAWRPPNQARVLVPLGGRRDQSHLRARLLATLGRSGAGHVIFLRIVPPDAPDDVARRAEREVRRRARRGRRPLRSRDRPQRRRVGRACAPRRRARTGDPGHPAPQPPAEGVRHAAAAARARDRNTPLVLISRRG